MGLVVALISVLTVLLSGLSVGLVKDGVSGLQQLPVTSLAFQEDVSTDSAFSRSVIPVDAVDDWAERPGVAAAAPLGTTLVNARTDREVEIDLALFGVETDSFLAPEPVSGKALADEGELVISETAAEQGLRIDDTVILEPSGAELTVVGILDGQHTYGHVDMGYLPLHTWQEVQAGIREGDPVPDRVHETVTAVAVQAADGEEVDLAAGDAAAGTTSLTLEESFGASPGYTAETSTLQLIQVFLYAISALVIGAFFTVLTIQRRQELAVLRALGASTRYLMRDSLLQSLVLLVVSAAVGIGLGVAAGAALASTPMPFALEVAPLAVATVLLIVLGVTGAGLAVLRITRVDPLTALGGSR